MGSNDVKLLTAYPSPYVMRAKIALNVKGVVFESIEQDLFMKGELLQQSNPVHKKVPVLIHGDKIICESLVIIEYIDQVWASLPKILPSNPYDRAMARFWATYIDSTWYPDVRSIVMFAEDEATIKKRYSRITSGLDLLEETFIKCSKGQKFFGGDKIGYLDIVLGGYLGWLRAVPILFTRIHMIDESKTPHLFKWSQDFCDHDAVKDVMQNVDKLVDYHGFLVSQLKAFGIR